jgi:Ca2+-binding RTX toxin-like protein
VTVLDVDGVTIVGTNGKDVIDTDDTVPGQPHPSAEDDTILGRKGKDEIDGLGDNDWIAGGKHRDTLTGGDGRDCFVFAERPGRKNADKITDFAVGEDKIYLDGDVFKKLKNAGDGMLKNGYFQDGDPRNAKDTVLYKNGKLFYDKDGDGDKAMKVIAKIGKGLDPSADDIIVI